MSSVRKLAFSLLEILEENEEARGDLRPEGQLQLPSARGRAQEMGGRELAFAGFEVWEPAFRATLTPLLSPSLVLTFVVFTKD